MRAVQPPSENEAGELLKQHEMDELLRLGFRELRWDDLEKRGHLYVHADGSTW
jgi:hypothetical protein